MSIVVNLATSIALAELAEQEGIDGKAVTRLLRRAARNGQAKAIAQWLLDEEQRIENEKVRRGSRR
jgi:hypothetical protein